MDHIGLAEFFVIIRMGKEERLDFLYALEHDLNWLIAIHGVIEMQKGGVNFAKTRFPKKLLEAKEDARWLIVAKTLARKACCSSSVEG